MISESHDLGGLDFGVNPSSPSAFVRKRARGFDEGQINEEALKRKALGEIAMGGGTTQAGRGIGNLPPGEMGNLIGSPERSGTEIPKTAITGNGNIVPESNDTKRLLRMIAMRKK